MGPRGPVPAARCPNVSPSPAHRERGPRVRAGRAPRIREEMTMAKTFRQMVEEGRQGTPTLSPQDAQKKMQDDPNTLVVDVRDAADLAGTGVIPGSINVS